MKWFEAVYIGLTIGLALTSVIVIATAYHSPDAVVCFATNHYKEATFEYIYCILWMFASIGMFIYKISSEIRGKK